MKKHKLWLPITAILLAAAAVAGILLVPRIPKEEVPVYPVTMVGYTDFYTGSSESYGMVTTDKVQTLFVSQTQTVTEILVYPGQEVKKGDILFTYDTTLSDLAVERKDLANQQLEAALKTAQSELAAIKKMKPIVYKPGTTSTTKTDYTKSPADKAQLNTVYSTKTTGKTSASPLYFWLQTGKQVDDTLIAGLFAHAKTQNGTEPEYLYVVFQMSSANRADTEFSVHTGVKFTKVYSMVEQETPTEPTNPTEPSQPTQPEEPEDPTESTPPAEATEPAEPSAPAESTAPTEPSEPSVPPEPSEPTEPSEPAAAAASSSARTAVKVLTGYSMTFFDPPSAPSEDSGTVQWNDGYTSAELTSMKKDKEDQIKQLQFDIKMGKAELNIMKKEADSGKVTAQFNGVVSEILDPAVARETGEPLMKVTGGGGYFVEGTVSELMLDTVSLGQTVTVTSWDTGGVYTGSIVEVGEYPIQNEGYYYGGSSNVSYYPYRVFIDESADLQEGYYVSMTYQTAEQAAGTLYLQNAFLRSEVNRTYVFVRNPEGLLEKRYLECGVSTDGYMTPVYSGITIDDYLAFPYGGEAAEGVPTFEGTDQDLYGY